MSRQQWGHGYWKGREDERKNTSSQKYIVVFGSGDEIHVNRVGQIREKHGDVLTVEWIDYFDIVYALLMGYEPSWNKVVTENVEEMYSQDIKTSHKLCYTWEAVVGELAKS